MVTLINLVQNAKNVAQRWDGAGILSESLPLPIPWPMILCPSWQNGASDQLGAKSKNIAQGLDGTRIFSESVPLATPWQVILGPSCKNGASDQLG